MERVGWIANDPGQTLRFSGLVSVSRRGSTRTNISAKSVSKERRQGGQFTRSEIHRSYFNKPIPSVLGNSSEQEVVERVARRPLGPLPGSNALKKLPFDTKHLIFHSKRSDRLWRRVKYSTKARAICLRRLGALTSNEERDLGIPGPWECADRRMS